MVEEYAKDVIMKERKRWLLFGIPWTFTKYTLTPKRIILNEGLLRSTENEILLYRIIDIELSKHFFRKFLSLVQLQLNQRTHLTLFLKLKILKMQEHSEIVLQRPLKMKGSE